MKLRISSLYCEPSYFFSISYKVDLLIEKRINEMLFVPYGLDKMNPETILNLIVSTNSSTHAVGVKGKILNRKSGFINWGIWLPYNEIAEVPNQLPPYIKYFIDATTILLNKYNIIEADIRKVQADIERTVMNNSEYSYI